MPLPRAAFIPAAAALLAVLLVWRVSASPASDHPLIAHEWGTFTALQDDDGTALGAINADDEPVPDFVCRTGGIAVVPAPLQFTAFLGGKGLWPCHPGVTMRLETPVIYFYPPTTGQPAPVNVRVTFHGGWLTEFYPQATVTAPDLLNSPSSYPPLTSTTTGSLAWSNVELDATGDMVPTTDPVWLAPRKVSQATMIKVPGATGTGSYPSNYPEKFLFYRGVGHLDSPLRAVRDPRTDRLRLFPGLTAQSVGTPTADLRVPAAWLIEIRPQDGFCAFRPVPGELNLRMPANQSLATLPASFAPGDFSAGRLTELRAAMQAALVTAGLFPDEAAAMLETWELSYFKSPGRRLFYITPRAWTDAVLPLSIDGAEITRAMIGRIELITPGQRERLTRIAAGPCPDMPAFQMAYWKASGAAHDAGAPDPTPGQIRDIAQLNVPIPALYQDYLGLGRFRDALVLDEQRRRPTPALAAFLTANRLQPR